MSRFPKDPPVLLCEPEGGPLLAWYDRCKRDLPWRRTSDPYAVWVSEIMLQQTQVATVIPYWERWMLRFPNPASLAAADEQDVLALWQGLGYYRRCRMLHDGAKFVAANGLPASADAWRKVPGVGLYTSGAIASIALGEPVPLVDGNVERVYARLCADPSVGKELHQNAWKWAESNLYATRPGDWNQALMELGATVCKPVNPNCGGCPVSAECAALKQGKVDALPRREEKPKTVKLKHLVCIPIFGDEVGLRQIPEGQWWQGMWEFPRVDASRDGALAELEEIVGSDWMQFAGTHRHAVTNHRIELLVHFARCENAAAGLRWVRLTDLDAIPMPAPQRKALELVRSQL